MTKKHIAKLYANLLKDVATKDFYKIDITNRVNCYRCTQCQRFTKTKDVDAGVTPFIHKCEYCGGTAQSTFYHDVAQSQKPTQEWYRPSLEQVLKMDEWMRDHVLQGGLVNRTLTP